MKIERRFIDSIDFEFNNGLIISLWQCLTEILLWKKYNWNTWQFINIEFENDTYTGAYEFMIILFCCGIRIRIPHETAKSKEFWQKTKHSLNIIKKSFEGWTTEQDVKDYKENKKSAILVWKKRKYVPKVKGSKFKKLFIQ